MAVLVRSALLGLGAAAAVAAALPARGGRSINTLPAPARLMVEHLVEPDTKGGLLVLSTLRPRFAFVPHAQYEHPGAGVAMSAYRIIVSSSPAAAGGWDSGIVNASAAVGVRCGTDLKAMTSYTWTAQWWAEGADVPSPTASASFDIGPVTAADWHGAPWVGEGQNEFRYQFAAGAATKLFIAAPGGSVVTANGHPVTDECGLSAWIDLSKNLPYSGVTLAPFLDTEHPDAATQTVVVRIGSGFYSGSRWRPNPAGGEGHSGGGAVTHSAVRLLLVDMHGAPAKATLTGRTGAAVSVDPFTGGIFDQTLADSEGWAPAKTVADLKAARLDGPLHAFALPAAKTAPAAASALRSRVVSMQALPPAPAPTRCATHCDPTTSNSANKTLCPPTLPPEHGGCDPLTPPQKRWHFGFSRNIIGMAALQPSSYKLNCGDGKGCKGTITIQYCEVFNSSAYTKYRTPGIPFPQYEHLCGPLANLAVVADSFLIDATTKGVLRPSFTWHGFQHIIVSVSDTVTFAPTMDAVIPQWTAVNAEATGAIKFGGGKDSTMLNKIVGIAQAGQLSNMAAFVPTDCPTREYQTA
eukprot:COSAG01_NODE_732_length_13996_cov_33.626322_15_plen_580_part_00